MIHARLNNDSMNDDVTLLLIGIRFIGSTIHNNSSVNTFLLRIVRVKDIS